MLGFPNSKREISLGCLPEVKTLDIISLRQLNAEIYEYTLDRP
jgi:hypothetical protein